MDKEKEATRKRAWYAAHKDQEMARMARYRVSHKEQISKQMQIYERRRKYGLTTEQFNSIADQQNGHCLICGCVPAKGLHIDHCHKTGRVRGLLCSKCNMGLGCFEDSLERLERARIYVEYWRSQDML